MPVCLWRRWVMDWCLFKVIFIFSITEINVSTNEGAFCSPVSQSVSSLNVNYTNTVVFQRDIYTIFNSPYLAQQNSRFYPSSNLAVLMFIDIVLSLSFCPLASDHFFLFFGRVCSDGSFQLWNIWESFFSNQQFGEVRMKLASLYQSFASKPSSSDLVNTLTNCDVGSF